jgi:hypothetical protein
MNQVNPVFMEEKECILSNFLPGCASVLYDKVTQVGI